ncbi:MAG: transcriptional regulator NrdR [Gammaproteobacteria bacterium]
MRCPFCHQDDTRVIDSRLFGEGDRVRRRRQCGGCNSRFTTYEQAELAMPGLVKSDGSRDVFNEAKLRAGIDRALEKRPVSSDQRDELLARLVSRLQTHEERECPTSLLGQWVMDELRKIDEVAYVRFASVYRRFEDVDAFRDEIDKLRPAAKKNRSSAG